MSFQRNDNDSQGLLERRLNQVMRMMERYKYDNRVFDKQLYDTLENNFHGLVAELKNKKNHDLYAQCVNWYTQHKGVEHL